MKTAFFSLFCVAEEETLINWKEQHRQKRFRSDLFSTSPPSDK